MGEFGHVILTVFNVRLQFGGNTAPDEEWLKHRFDLFDSFCYPSVRGQKNLNFKWLVFFDVSTPEHFRKKIASYAQWENFVPYYVDHPMSVDLFAGMKKDVISQAIPRTNHLISTLLDNDDALSMNYVESIQNLFCGQKFEFINFTNGYVLNKENNRLYSKKDDSNPFISLIETMEDFKTVWCGSHHELSSQGNMRQVETHPMWLQVVHGRNVLNNVGIRRRVPIKLLDGTFSLGYTYDPDSENEVTVFLENVRNKFRYLATMPTRL